MEIKKVKIEDYNDLLLNEQIETLKKDNKTFFVDSYNIFILESGLFIEFYLHVFKFLCKHFCDEVESLHNTDYHFYISKRLNKSFNHLEIEVFSKYLGKNFDSYDFTDTDDIFIMY